MFLSSKNKYKSLDDSALIAAFKESASNRILSELYERYGHLVFGTCLKYMKNKQDAEDITMVLFAQLPEKIIRSEIQYFKSWLYRVTCNECLMVLRKKGIPTSDVPIEETSIAQDDSIIHKEEQLQLLEAAIETLNDEQRKTIHLFYIEGKSYQQVSEITGLEIKKVKSAIQNGKRNLKIKLEDRNEFKSIT
jgi:RNA polymerase sigma-70 factor (ECF subfamily)